MKLVSWKDLELKVVGDPEVDIDRLKEMTEYRKCDEGHKVVRSLWRVLHSFNNEQRKAYLKYVWGRIRLPPREENEIELHTVELIEKKSQNDLPFGRTCYFKLEIPPYKDDELLKKKLLYALENCTTIDGDHNNYEMVDDRQSDGRSNDSRS